MKYLIKEASSTSILFRIGWFLLLLLTSINIANSTYLVFTDRSWVDGHSAWLFMAIYAFFVLLIPYRHRERWAWYLSWLFAVPFFIFGFNHFNELMFGPGYMGVALLTAIAQILTWPSFRLKARNAA